MAFLFRSLRLRLVVISLAVIVILYLIIYNWLPDGLMNDSNNTDNINVKLALEGPITAENVQHRVTIIIREFEDFDNVLPSCVEDLDRTLKGVKVFIVADKIPYPPVDLSSNKASFILTKSSNLLSNYSSSCPLAQVDTDYVFIIPDNVKIRDWSFIKSAAAFLRSRKNIKAVAVPISNKKLECVNMSISLKEWTILFPRQESNDITDCSLIRGDHGLFLETKTLKTLTEPLARPFPFTFYVQALVKRWNTRIMKSGRLELLKELYKNPHSSWKHKMALTERTKTFYKSVGIKRELLPTGVSQFYGCNKKTARCFGTVLNDMPQYLYEGRWTPPCCLKALRETAAHVFKTLVSCGVRYWLEGGSLLGAARSKDIIPWDYDVDIGIYKEDIKMCPALVNAAIEAYVDDLDFVWEKATEGEFFRVQYSESNHLHVDIYPFYSKNGIMTKDSWFPTHRQDTEFPETYLKPLTWIEFAGINASAPNNVKKFLEYKFGDGVIENPRYPNLRKPVS